MKNVIRFYDCEKVLVEFDDRTRTGMVEFTDAKGVWVTVEGKVFCCDPSALKKVDPEFKGYQSLVYPKVIRA